jgi:mitofilin
MVYQAEEDAKVFKAELSKAIARKDAESRKRTASLAQEHASAAENAASQIGALANEIERSERRVAALVSELERVGADAEAAVETQRAEAEAESARALEEQAELHRMAIAECLVRERTKRAEVIDEVRLKLDGVKEAYDVNGAALRKSHGAVKMSVAVFALAAKASAGEPFSTELAGIRTVGEQLLGGDDSERALVDAVLASIPEAVAKTGVPTAGDLTNRLDDVRRAARHLQLVPSTGGGIVTHLVAYLASWLRVSERGGWGTGNDGSSSTGGVEAALAAANEKVAAGRLDAAAAALEAGTEGTAAARAVAGWVADARERQRLEMAVSVLRSHAASVASSLA